MLVIDSFGDCVGVLVIDSVISNISCVCIPILASML